MSKATAKDDKTPKVHFSLAAIGPLNRTQSASLLRMSVPNFVQLIERGVITKPPGGASNPKYDPDVVLEEYITYIRAIASGRGGRTAEGLDPLAQRARKDKEMADRVALQNAVTRGELAPVDEFKAVLEDAFVRFRSRILGAPSKMAPRLEGASRTEIKASLEAELEEALDEIRTTKFVPKALRSMREDELPPDEDESSDQ